MGNNVYNSQKKMSEEAFIKALRKFGYITPHTDDEAKACYDLHSDPSIKLPYELQDMDSVLDRFFNGRNTPKQTKQDG